MFSIKGGLLSEDVFKINFAIQRLPAMEPGEELVHTYILLEINVAILLILLKFNQNMPLKSQAQFRHDLFDYPCKEFIKHLDKENNERIVFSGKFGIGKTVFLNHFFKSQTQIHTLSDVKFRAFFISPINY